MGIKTHLSVQEASVLTENRRTLAYIVQDSHISVGPRYRAKLGAGEDAPSCNGHSFEEVHEKVLKFWEEVFQHTALWDDQFHSDYVQATLRARGIPVARLTIRKSPGDDSYSLTEVWFLGEHHKEEIPSFYHGLSKGSLDDILKDAKSVIREDYDLVLKCSLQK